MSISNALIAAQGRVADAYTAISNKGGTLPATQDLSNMPTAISSIPTGSSPVIQSLNVTPSTSAQEITATGGVDGYSPVNVSAVTSSIDANITAGNIKDGVTILGVTGNYSGTTPSGTLPITSNGIYDVTNYASADVNVSSSGYVEVPRYEIVNGVAQKRSGSLVFTDVTAVGDYALSNLFTQYAGITSVDISSLTTVSGTQGCMNAFLHCTGITSADISSLTTVSGYQGCSSMFSGCTQLAGNIDLSSLTTLSANYACNGMFSGCANITGTDLSSLTTISTSYACNSMFKECTNLASVDLINLTTISGSNSCQDMFKTCNYLTSIDLGSLTSISGTDACKEMFSGCNRLQSADLSSLTTISGGCRSMFSGCAALTSIDLSSLTTISGECAGMFASCSSLVNVDFANLTTISNTYSGIWNNFMYGCSNLKTVKLNKLNVLPQLSNSSNAAVFGNCENLESIELGGLTASTFASAVNQLPYLVNIRTGGTAPNGCTIHFPSNFDPSDPNHTFDASTLTGYPNFNGSLTYIHVAFDLPATE